MIQNLRLLKDNARAKLATRRCDVFLANLMIAGAVAFFVLFFQQTEALPRLLNGILHLLTFALAALFNFKNARAFSAPGLVFDALAILVAVSFWTFIRSSAGRILANLVLLVLLLGTTMLLLNRYRIISSAAAVVFGMLLMSIAEVAYDTVRGRVRRTIVLQKQDAEYSVIGHLAHNLKPGLQIARSPLLALRAFLEERGLLDAVLSRRMDGSAETVADALANAVTSLAQLNDIIDNTRKLVVQEILPEDFREHDLAKLLKEEVLPLHAASVRVTVHGSPCAVRLHRESFVEAMHNLLRNAKVHAFHPPSPTDEATFHLRETRRSVVIDYHNNGRPFPKNLSARDFLSFGKKSAESPGEALGGAWIGKMVESHGGKFEIVRDEHPLHFRITLPKRGKN